MDRDGSVKQRGTKGCAGMATEEEIARRIREAGERALAEAEERRTKTGANQAANPKETGGPKGPEPTRYGDWERKGLISDF